MAGPYTHLRLAWQHLVETDDDLARHDPGSYLLGSTSADIIRVTLHDDAIPRELTHPSLTEFCNSVARGVGRSSPGARAFSWGYLVHLVTDKIWHDLVYLDLLEVAGEARSQGPRLTLLVDRGLWLQTSSRVRGHLAETVAGGTDWGVIEGRLATRTPAARVLAGKGWAIADWRARLAHAIRHGPETLGLGIADAGAIIALGADAPVFRTVTAFVAAFQRRLSADLRRARAWFEVTAGADLGEDGLPDGVAEALGSCDSTPGEFSRDDRALARGVIDGLLAL
jgi:hypothetical protein